MDDQHRRTTVSAESQNRAIRGVLVVRALNTLDGMWTGHIRPPDQKGRRAARFTINHTIFVRSLRPLLDMALMANAGPTQIALLLNAYWNGIARVLPEPFDRAHDANDYVIQQNQGTTVLHSVLPRVIEVIPAQGRSLADRTAYADVMHDLPTLSGEVTTDHGPEPVSGATFWLAGAAGAASQFSGADGRKRLSGRVQALLPRVPEGLEIERRSRTARAVSRGERRTGR